MSPRSARRPRLAPRLARATLAAVTTVALIAPPASAKRLAGDPPRSFEAIVAEVAEMVSDEEAQALVRRRGLGIVNVMWEDTGRWEGSSVGPNISDVTIEVEASGGADGRRTYLMPVIRHDNFTDKTADVRLDRIFVPVGNQRGGKQLDSISLADLLADPGRHLSRPGKGTIKGGSLLAKRDTHALVSAQHAFLPVPRGGKATFWPVIFNYQSYAENPAVLTILVTRQGASMTVVDNQRDTVTGGGSWGQRLYFNQDGKKAPLIAERLKDVKRAGTTANGETAASLGEDANLLMIIQVPLKQKARPTRAMAGDGIGYGAGMADATMAPSAPMAERQGDPRGRSSDVDVAVLGHGETEGPFTELDGLTIARDPRFPVRVTIQFYQATSNGAVSTGDVARMADQLRKVYGKGDYVGSLVAPTPADRRRPTSWVGVTAQPDGVDMFTFPGVDARFRKYGYLYVPVMARPLVVSPPVVATPPLAVK